LWDLVDGWIFQIGGNGNQSGIDHIGGFPEGINQTQHF